MHVCSVLHTNFVIYKHLHRSLTLKGKGSKVSGREELRPSGKTDEQSLLVLMSPIRSPNSTYLSMFLIKLDY